MVTIEIGKYSSAQGEPLWVRGTLACIKLGNRLVQGELVGPAPQKAAVK